MRLCDEELAGQVPLAADTGRSSGMHSTHTLCDPPASVPDKMDEVKTDGAVPSLHSVDIPVVLPTHESRVPPPSGKTFSSSSNTSMGSKKDMHRNDQPDMVTQVPVQRTNKIANATQIRERTKPPGNYF